MSALTTLPGLHGPRWVVARQHRSAAKACAAVTLVAAVAVAAFLVAMTTDPEGEVVRYADGGMSTLLRSALTPLALLPALVGAFVAGPLVARELESGTYTWLWTQSVSPARWLATKLALVTAVTLTLTTVLVVLFVTARNGLSEGSGVQLTWDGAAYAMLGPVAVAQCALAVGIGTLVGLLVRRTVPSMVVTALAVVVTQSVFALWLREMLWPVRTLVSRTPIEVLHTPGVWTLADGMLTASGARVLSETCLGPTGVGMTQEECMAQLGGVSYFADIHPESHFWPMQLVETGILLALAGIAVTVAFRVLGKQHAGAA